MVKEWIRSIFGKKEPTEPGSPPSTAQSPTPNATRAPATVNDEPKWIEASDNPWAVHLLDVRPVTQTMMSTSSDPQCAANAVSFGQDDGLGFAGQFPLNSQRLPMNLRFPIDQRIADGALFIPRQMEHKWALFVHQQSIICVRSWSREVQAIAHFKIADGFIHIYEMQGALLYGDPDPVINQRLLDYLLRSHALNLPYPVPLTKEMELVPKAVALWCMSVFGNLALFATPHEVAYALPEKPLRTHSLLHIAVARGDMDAVAARLQAGDPLDLLAGDGMAPLHWAMVSSNPGMLAFLLKHGADIEVRTVQGATALMNATQGTHPTAFDFLLAQGANPNARDLRGFTALHRAAEMGKLDLVKKLLQHGADASLNAEGHTALSLAVARNETPIVTLLENV